MSKILNIQASARKENSVTRALSQRLINALGGDVIERDVADGLPFVTSDWIAANFNEETDRTDAQKEILALSDELIAELEAADTLVIGLPIYNFGVPAVLKAWVDQIARARKTFKYTENGPVGLLEGKRAFIVAASGGTQAGSDIDFATTYMRHALGFIGIKDVELVAADQLMVRGDDSRTEAEAKLDALVAA